MADISKIKLPDGSEYNFKDSGAIRKNETGNTQQLRRPASLQGANDVTLDAKINTLRANRLAFLPPDQIIIEKTTDGGTTWVDYGANDGTKAALFAETRTSLVIPLLNGKKSPLCGLRVTITAMKYNVPEGTSETEKYNYWNSTYIKSNERYNQLKEMYFWVSTSGGYINVKVERARGNDSNNWAVIFNDTSFNMTGYSGNDYISFTQGVFGGGTTQTSNFWNYRITFMTDDYIPRSPYDTYDQSIMEIRGYGDTWWTKGNEYAANDKIYTHDVSQNVFFPGSIYPAANNTKTIGSSSYRWNTIYAATFDGVATTATQLYPQATVTTDTVDSFRGAYLRFANLSPSPIDGDGILIWIPWSDSYGRQLKIEEASNQNIWSRTYNKGTWSGWYKISATTDDIKSVIRTNSILFGGATGDMGSGAPAATVKEWYADTTKIPTNSIKSYISYSGKEYTVLFSNRNNYGSVLKWGYNDRCLRILRYNNSVWQSDDWEKIDAGNADTVNNHTVNSDVPANAKFTDTTYTGTAPITVSSSNVIAINDGTTAQKGAVKLNTATSSTSTTEAATPSAVKIAKDRADEAYSKAATVESGLNGSYIYDQTFSITNGVATFTPHVYLKGAEVTSTFAASCFVWKYRLIDGSEVTLATKSDRGCDVTITSMGYGGHVIGAFTPPA